LEAANVAKRKHRKKPSRPKPPPAPPRFAVSDKVRVRPGTKDPDFKDIPLGGWAGTITEADARSIPPICLIAWDRHTMEQMHPVYRRRCERDGLDASSMWLGEDDLVPDDGTPSVIEQPTAIRTRPLDLEDQDDRVRAVFGLTSDDPLPEVSDETLLAYHRHLERHLSFPFEARLAEEPGFQVQGASVTVVALLDAGDIGVEHGLLCEARTGGRRVEGPLGEVEARKGGPNRRLVEDYSYWFWNWR
jgi:Calcium binding